MVVVVVAGAVDVVVGGTVVVVVGARVVVVVGGSVVVVDARGRTQASRLPGRDVQAPAPITAAPSRRRSAWRRVSSGVCSTVLEGRYGPISRPLAGSGQAVPMVEIVDERAHPPGFDELWAESWYVDFAGVGDLGGFVSLCIYPNLKVAWWWTHLLTPGGLVAVRDHEVAPPRGGLEVRAEGLWGEMVCETPLEHWSLGLEAFGVRYDDPAEAWGAEWGERVAVGLDLEWETLGEPVEQSLPGPPGAPEGGYLQPGSVVGEILLGDGRIPFDGTGLRARRWGRADWWGGAARSWAGLIGDGGELTVFDEVARDGVEVLGTAPILITGADGAKARLERALCRSGGRRGWAEWLLPVNGGRTGS